MARTSLAELLPPDQPGERARVATDVEDPGTASRATSPVSQIAPKAGENQRLAEPESGPRYLQMERKEARIRLDQADALAQLTRRLNRARGGGGERITDNTLIRIAVDVLLARSDRLVGATEDELRDSLSP